MTSCLAPSPAVMSSLETSVTRSGLPLRAWIFLVLPSVTSAPRVSFDGRSLVLASKAAFLFLASVSKRNVQYFTGRLPAKSKRGQNRRISQARPEPIPVAERVPVRGDRQLCRDPHPSPAFGL